MSVIWTFIWLTLFGWAVFWLMTCSRSSSLAHLPSIQGWPIIGNLLQINSKKPYLSFTSWHKRLGDMFVVTLFGRSTVVLNSAHTIYEALITKAADFAGRPHKWNFRLGCISDGFQDLFFSNPTPTYKIMKKTCHRHIKMYDTGMKRIEEVNIDIIGGLVQEFHAHNGQPFNPRKIVYHTVMNIIVRLLINKKFEVASEEFELLVKLQRLAADNVAPGGPGLMLDMFPWLRFFGNKCYKELKLAKIILEKVWQKIKSQELEFQGKDEEGLMHAFFNFYQNQKVDPNDEAWLEEKHLKLVFQDMILGGTETSTNTYYTHLNILSQYAAVQQKLQEEVDAVVGPSRPVSLKDRDNMPYTRATIFELLRYTSVVPIFPRATLKDTSLNEHHIPAGTEIWINIWELHHDNRFWEEPYDFRPERFLDANGQMLPVTHDNRRHLLAFGAGHRVCIGEILALARLFFLIATTAQVFDIKPGPVRVSCDPRNYEPGFVLCPGDFEIKAISRNNIVK